MSAPLRLVGDVGGTHARFARVGTDGQLGAPVRLPSSEFFLCGKHSGTGNVFIYHGYFSLPFSKILVCSFDLLTAGAGMIAGRSEQALENPPDGLVIINLINRDRFLKHATPAGPDRRA